MINTTIALASTSPRRLKLLQALDLTVRLVEVSHDEVIDPSWPITEVPLQLAIQKNKHAKRHRKSNEILLTADTTVLLDDEILHKPSNASEARDCLKRLSGHSHSVITGICLSCESEISFSVTTTVRMTTISSEAMDYYIRNYRPFDKAGAYGIQEWIGWSHVLRIEGSYSNVMGLPTCEVYEAIKELGP